MKTTAILLTLLLACSPAISTARDWRCAPTRPDMLGPFYKEGAPVRNEVGEGYRLTGRVRSAADCSPIAEAKIEFWMAGPDGRYEDRWRATVYPDRDGRYLFRTVYPAPYGRRPPHIHVRVTAPGFAELVTQHYPEKGADRAEFDLTLIPE